MHLSLFSNEKSTMSMILFLLTSLSISFLKLLEYVMANTFSFSISFINESVDILISLISTKDSPISFVAFTEVVSAIMIVLHLSSFPSFLRISPSSSSISLLSFTDRSAFIVFLVISSDLVSSVTVRASISLPTIVFASRSLIFLNESLSLRFSEKGFSSLSMIPMLRISVSSLIFVVSFSKSFLSEILS